MTYPVETKLQTTNVIMNYIGHFGGDCLKIIRSLILCMGKRIKNICYALLNDELWKNRQKELACYKRLFEKYATNYRQKSCRL